MTISLVVDNTEIFRKNPPYSAVASILDAYYDHYRDRYRIDVLLSNGDEHAYLFAMEGDADDALEHIGSHLASRSHKAPNLQLVHSAPPTWLDIARRRVANGHAATRSERERNNRSITRDLR